MLPASVSLSVLSLMTSCSDSPAFAQTFSSPTFLLIYPSYFSPDIIFFFFSGLCGQEFFLILWCSLCWRKHKWIERIFHGLKKHSMDWCCLFACSVPEKDKARKQEGWAKRGWRILSARVFCYLFIFYFSFWDIRSSFSLYAYFFFFLFFR